MLTVIDKEKIKRARKYVNEMSSSEFLELCYDFYNYSHGGNNKENGVYNKALEYLNLWSEPVAIKFAIYEKAHKTFDKIVLMLLEDDVKRYLNYEVQDDLYRNND